MDDDHPEQLRAVATQVAKDAAEVAAGMRAHAGDQVRTKSSSTDVVTEADTATEALLRRRLAQLRPDDAVLGEEGGLSTGEAAVPPGTLCWVVDPIDGTVNYLYGIPWYAVSVAVIGGGKALAGAVVEPASGRVWSASAGGGATLDGVGLRVSDRDRLELALIATGFSYESERRARQGALAGALLPRVRDIRRFGSAALDLCAVAAGWCDGYYEHAINHWDWAAGALIAGEAGAVVRDPDSNPGLGRPILAGAPGVIDQLADTLGELGAGKV
jgi:myo-inositol-1(or 4)-monophosphatase